MTTDLSTSVADIPSLNELAQASPQLSDQATFDGLVALIEKVAPLLQGQRLHNVVDLLSAVSDLVDMADDAMIEKLMKGYEEAVAGAWALGNATRYAMLQAAQEQEPPSIWQSFKRLNRDEDARRGLSVVVNMLATVGRQARVAGEPLPDD